MPDVGTSAVLTKRITRHDIELFTELTRDRNPIHYDEDLARSTVFGGLIIQNGVTMGILNALVAESLPGPGSVFLSMNLNFPKAVFVGDVMTGRVVATSVRTDNPICNLEVSVTNQHGQPCLTGTATTYTVPLPLAENIRPS
jgi:acyl dehydratase